jgi:hypothetical protein
MDGAVRDLVRTIVGLQRYQATLERQWVGRHVRLLEPIGRLPEGPVLIEAGTVGQVAKIRLSQEAPLVVRFPGVVLQIAPLPHMLEVLDE